jgi:hypothetical protein
MSALEIAKRLQKDMHLMANINPALKDEILVLCEAVVEVVETIQSYRAEHGCFCSVHPTVHFAHCPQCAQTQRWLHKHAGEML